MKQTAHRRYTAALTSVTDSIATVESVKAAGLSFPSLKSFIEHDYSKTGQMLINADINIVGCI